MNNETRDEVVYLYLDDIIPNRFQPREVFDEKALKELAVSIKEHGVIQPIIVRSVNDKYEIIAGERRYKASALAGQTKIPAIIRNLDDKESSKVALLENLQRKNLTPIEEARTYQKILEIDQMTQDELAKTMGKSQSSVANKLRLLTLPDEVQDSLLKEQISERHARALLNLSDVQKQKDLLKKIMQQKMSVRAVEEEIKRINSREIEGSDNMDNQQLPPMGGFSQPGIINDAPLVPTAAMIEDEPEEEFGTVKIVPPTEYGTTEEKPKFINFAEEPSQPEEPTETLDFHDISTPLDLNEIRNNASDIKPTSQPTSSTSNDLDALLNIQTPEAKNSVLNDENYISSVDKYIKTEGFVPQQEKVQDYFKAPDVMPTMPDSVYYTVDVAMEKIRDLVTDLEAHGVKIRKDEMNFEKSFQVILKIDKNS